jgi:Asp-tRNA(Asn)/Glu-tRNA(Gln) amidotransferase A subunit family amidase
MTRIEEVNPRLNAAVQLCAERSLDEAHAADQALARGGEDVALAIAYYLEQAFGVWPEPPFVRVTNSQMSVGNSQPA